mmetsp:Transcript_22978/g.42273  ORF Transcript_22978/g.42273 Transcript_22978/m.42273 type:complete len:221 (+) Transcript_22978:94-756(+)
MGNVCAAKPCFCLKGGSDEFCGQCGQELISGNPHTDASEAKLSDGPKPTKSSVLRMDSGELARAESWIHQRAYSMFDDLMNQSVPWNHELLQSYVLEHTCLTEATVGDELMRAALGRPFLTAEGFALVMCRYCMPPNECAGRWARISRSRFQIEAEECRQGLQDFLAECMQLSDAEMQKANEVLDAVMRSTGVTVGYAEWESLMTRTARVQRLLKQLPLL